ASARRPRSRRPRQTARRWLCCTRTTSRRRATACRRRAARSCRTSSRSPAAAASISSTSAATSSRSGRIDDVGRAFARCQVFYPVEPAAPALYKGGRPRSPAMKSLYLIALAAAASAAAAHAQTVDDAPIDLGSTVVTATRHAEDPLTVPAAVDAVERDDIRRARPRIGLAESL